METKQSREQLGESIFLDEAKKKFLISRMWLKGMCVTDVATKLNGLLSNRTVTKVVGEGESMHPIKLRTVFIVANAIGIPQSELLREFDLCSVITDETTAGGEPVVNLGQAKPNQLDSKPGRNKPISSAEQGINLGSLKEDHAALAPKRYWKHLTTPEQKQAIHEEYHHLLGALENIAAGRIPLRLDERGYFEYLLQRALEGALVNARAKEKVCIFARLLHLDVCNRLTKLGEMTEPFKQMVAAINDGRLEFEYVVFLRNRDSLAREDTRKMLHLYGATASAVYVLFENEGKVTTHETARTIAMFQTTQRALTHGWSYSGNIEDVLWCIRPAEYTRLLGIYENLKSKSELCMEQGELTDEWQHLILPKP